MIFRHTPRLCLPALAIAAALAGCSGSSSDDSYNTDGSSEGVIGDSPLNDPYSPVSLPDDVALPPESGEEPPIDGEQTSFYFSYDESTSTAARDLSLFAIDNGFRPGPSLGRAFEFLNAESFQPFSSQAVGPFSVSMGMLATTNSDLPTRIDTTESLYALGVNLSGPEQTLEQRRNVVLTVLVDVSGSMESAYASETRTDIRSLLDVARHGLSGLPESLKEGDVVNLVKFSTQAQVLLEADSGQSSAYTNTVNSLATENSTDINEGLKLAYEVANRTYDPQKANRVLLVTDAYVNTGEVDADIIAQQTVINGLEGIYFSGIGVGSNFNDAVLDTLTDTGKGSYSGMITPDDAERLFTEGFMRFIEPAFTDVRFRLSYPQQLDQLQSAAEEISTNADDIQPVNFSYNSDQFFLEIFTGPEDINSDQNITLDIEYTDAQGEAAQVSTSMTLAQLFSQGENSIRAAALVSTLAGVIAEQLDCDAALASMLYTNPIEDLIYARYRDALTDYCALQEPYTYLIY
ncbi:vWA domain-containing protein [Granulosicoccus antarcticus]|uniref:VWFA domain-containing protein n=1 Tax=Granulosicoccus antarcticus IMCC3135 TaxID=1192854 RepID=A0A2Z2NYY3_9GAMM|nr:VWA domain-containing protein [Granulosicoccus antarcticus]ASJ72987.1 hypothetical protein IMCC3135_14510 [Granulosicoccus antarcticus IMCC3135]